MNTPEGLACPPLWEWLLPTEWLARQPKGYEYGWVVDARLVARVKNARRSGLVCARSWSIRGGDEEEAATRDSESEEKRGGGGLGMTSSLLSTAATGAVVTVVVFTS